MKRFKLSSMAGLIAVVAVVTVVLSAGYAQDEPQKKERQYIEASDGTEILLITSMDDWNYFLEQIQNDPDHPLHSVDDETLGRFTESLCFGETGLGGLYYGGIGHELTYFDFFRLFEHFGLDLSNSIDLYGQQCNSNGNCETAVNYICGENCGS